MGGDAHVRGGVLAIVVRAYLAGIVFGQHRAADHDRAVGAVAAKQFDRALHVGHGRRHQCGKTAQFCAAAFDLFGDGLATDVLAKVDDVVAVVGEHRLDDVLADVVDVALDGREHDRVALDGRLGHALFDLVEAQLGGVGGGDQLRQKQRALFVIVADGVERRDEVEVDQFERSYAAVQHCRGFGLRGRQPLADEVGEVGLVLVGRGRFRLGGGGVFGGVCCAIDVLAAKRLEGGDRLHILGNVGVEYRRVQPRPKRGGEEGGVDRLALGQSERDVADAQHRAHVVFALYAADRLEGAHRLFLLCADGQGETVDEDVLFGDAVFFGGGDDLACDAEPVLDGLGDAVLVHAQRDDRRAVLCRDGQNAVERVVVAADRVDDRLAVIGAQCRLDRVRLGAIDLQRQIGDALEQGHHVHERRLFVDVGKPRVDVEDVRARLFLLDRLAGDVVVVAAAQRLFHRLFAGRVDAFADHADGVERDRAASGADRGDGLCRTLAANASVGDLAQQLDVFGSGAAAAADDRDAEVDVLGAIGGELFGADRVVALLVGKPCVGLHDDGLCGQRRDLFDDGQKLVGPQRAIDPDRVRKGRGGQHERRHVAAGEGAHVVEEGHRRDDGKGAVFADGEQRGAKFGKVGHRLDEHEVGVFARDYGAAIDVVSLIEGHRAERLEHLPGRAQVEGDQLAGGGVARQLDRRGNYAVGQLARLGGVGAEGRGRDDVRSGGGICAVNAREDLGRSEHELFGQSARIDAHLLEHAAHRAVKDDDLV